MDRNLLQSAEASQVILAYDATRDQSQHELRLMINSARMYGQIISGCDTLLVLGVLHTITNPMGYQTKACTDSFAGTNARALEEAVMAKADMYESMFPQRAETCGDEGVSMSVKITAGTPSKRVILQEVTSCKATWLVLDRSLRRDMKSYVDQIPCKVALIQDNLSVEVIKPFASNPSSTDEQKSFYSTQRPLHLAPNISNALKDKKSVNFSRSNYASKSFLETSIVHKSSRLSPLGNKPKEQNKIIYEMIGSLSRQTGTHPKEHNSNSASQVLPNQNNTHLDYETSEKPILCSDCGLRSTLYVKESMRFQFSEIREATSDFSKENLLGEGGFGHVYKGELKDGQKIAAKLRKETSTQGYSEFFSEVHVLSFVRHRNIVMLLGYCCKENHNILVYEYICNKSLDWHLFGESGDSLEWHTRYAMAIGIAKGLRFLHEECRGGPIIHRDLRPSNILLTHDFVPMLADFGLAKWKACGDSFQTEIIGTTGYLAPEYAEYGIVSARTDVYAFGIVLFQLISGCKVVDEKKGQMQHLLQWAEPLVETLALHELIDDHLGESYDTYELYLLARAAFLCVRGNPEMRPSMGEVVRLLEAKNKTSEEFWPSSSFLT